jgi:hypothetical protein
MTTTTDHTTDRQDNDDQAAKAMDQVAVHSECNTTEISQLTLDEFWGGNDSLGG